jgi:hypothetical protein
MTESGIISLDHRTIRYRWPGGDWAVRIETVHLIGEYTKEEWPGLDDHFLCFASDDRVWLEASFYAEGRDEFLSQLGKALVQPLDLGLCGKTSFDSRLLWPPHLAGRPMFEFVPNWPRNRIARALCRLLGGPSSNTQTFSPEALQHLRHERSRGPRPPDAC